MFLELEGRGRLPSPTLSRGKREGEAGHRVSGWDVGIGMEVGLLSAPD